MSKRCELQKEYYQANGAYKGNGKYNDKYVRWLEDQILALRMHDIAESFIGWRDKLHKEMRGGKLMFDVPKHYKWLDESELFTYWMDVGRYCR